MESQYITISADAFRKIINSFEENLTVKDTSNYFDVQKACAYLKCSVTYLWRMRKSGKLNAISSGRKIYFRKNDLDAFLESNIKEVGNG